MCTQFLKQTKARFYERPAVAHAAGLLPRSENRPGHSCMEELLLAMQQVSCLDVGIGLGKVMEDQLLPMQLISCLDVGTG